MFNCVVLLIITILYGVLLNKLRKRVEELETDVYFHMEGTHYPAIKNEFASVWREIKGDEDDDNC